MRLLKCKTEDDYEASHALSLSMFDDSNVGLRVSNKALVAKGLGYVRLPSVQGIDESANCFSVSKILCPETCSFAEGHPVLGMKALIDEVYFL